MRLVRFFCLVLLLPPQLWASDISTQTAGESVAHAPPNHIWQGDLLPNQLNKFAKGQYNQVDGSVYINNSELTDLSALSRLTSVSGSVRIGQAPSSHRKQLSELNSFSLTDGGDADIEPLKIPLGGNPQLKSLTGLEQLQHIGGALNIEDNPQLESIKALSALNSLSYVTIKNNHQLRDLHGLETLAQTAKQPHSLLIANNPNINSLSPLSGMHTLTSLVIMDQPNLKDLTGLESLTRVVGYVILRRNQQLNQLKGLDNLESIEEHLSLVENPSLTQIQNLSALNTLSGELLIEKNRRLKNLSGLKKIKTIKALTITDNTALASLKGLNGLTRIKEDIKIINNPSLEDTLALNQITHIGGGLGMFDNAYTTLKGFENLKSINTLHINTNIDKATFAKLKTANTVHVYIKKGPVIHALGGVLPRLTSVKTLDFSGSDKLETLGDFLPNLKYVEYLTIYSNKSIKDFNGLNKLKYAKEITIKHNESINKITGFNSLKKVDEMRIEENLNLQSITGFNGLLEATRVVIEDNTDLLNLQGFNKFTKIDDFWVQDNKVLQHISAFNSVNTIKNTLWVDNNPNLKDLGNIPLQEQVKNLYIDDNTSLTHLNALNTLKYAESLRISNNGITDLTGLEQLKSAGYLRIQDNSKLESLEALKNLTDVDKLEIDDNDTLTNLNGLGNIKHLNSLVITDNGELNDYDGLSLWTLNARDVELSNNKFDTNRFSLVLSAGLTKYRFDPDELEKNTRLKELYFLRNEAFARQGFVFGKEDLIEHFSRFGWYKPDENAKIKLNDVTEENIKIIKAIEAKAHANIQKAIDTLKNKQNEFLAKEDAFFAPSVSRFAQTLSVKKIIQADLSYAEDYFIHEEGCFDKLAIDFSDKAEHFSFSVNHCVYAKYNENTDELEAIDGYKLCNMRVADAQREEVFYTWGECGVDTTQRTEDVQLVTKTFSYDFELNGDRFILKQRDVYDDMEY